MKEEKLKRVLGLGYTTLFGVGLILGAGIYVLIGRAAGFSGDAVWLSVLFATFIALTTGLSYAELSSMYPTAASTHTYVEEAFPKRGLLAFIAGWLIFFEGVAGAATASVGFARYFTQLFTMGEYWIPLVAILLVVVLSFVNWFGIEESALMTVIFTFIEAGGLILVVLLGFMLPQRSPDYLAFNPTLDPMIGILIGAAVFYFAFTGFELQPTLSEETREPRKTIPKAIILALLITSLLYLLVALAVVRLLPWDVLADTRAPLAEAAAMAWKPAYMILMFIALFSTTNTVLGFLVSASRLAYGLASEGIVSEQLAKVDKWRKTPYISVLISGFVAVLTILITVFLPEITGLRLRFGEVEYKLVDMVGKTSSLAAILAFIMVNVAVIVLRFTKPDYERRFTIPLNIGRFPVLPAISIVLIVFFLAISFTDWIIWISTAVVILIGLAFYKR
ncbi:MAG: amino acid transporter [Thermoprotei archaeon]|nr:MAG: amino acid transporter [Thermoprotei archaeon]